MKKSAIIPPLSPATNWRMWRKTIRFISLFVIVAILMPIVIGGALAYGRGWPESWRTASWSSSGLLPPAAGVTDAQVLVLATRTGRWKSVFAEHMSIVVKPVGAADWVRYDVVGWGQPVRRDAYAADAFWYGNAPYVAARIEGAAAEMLIPRIEATITRYPHSGRGTYTVWPGPNSNTFVAWVVRNTDGFDVELPPAAIGKDYLGHGISFAPAASRTGYMISAWGLVGFTAALREGLEFNLLGATIGIDPDDLAIKLPALGKLSLLDLRG